MAIWLAVRVRTSHVNVARYDGFVAKYMGDPCVLDAAIVARPDPMWGETPCAFVTLKPEAETSAEDIIAFCRERLAHFKAPRTVIFGPLPKTSTGKIQKFLLRKRAKGAV